jgi:hypothetical protein
MNVFLGTKDLELVFRGLMVLPWAEANHLIVRLQNMAKNEDLNKALQETPQDKPQKTHKYGIRKDGKPRGKPGPKAKQ